MYNDGLGNRNRYIEHLQLHFLALILIFLIKISELMHTFSAFCSKIVLT